MKAAVFSHQMKQYDQYTIEKLGIPSMVLMERAALAVYEIMTSEYKTFLSKILIVCGSGNNGADGVALARLLHAASYQVEVYIIGNEERYTEEMKMQIMIAKNHGVNFRKKVEWDEYTAIVDAIFGVGLHREINGEIKNVIEHINESSAWKAAVDIPSGVDGNSGKVLGCAVKVDITVSFQFEKTGLLLYPGALYAGKCYVKEVGILADPKIDMHVWHITQEDLYEYPKRNRAGNKGTFGKVLSVTGSKGMSGAAFLGGKAALSTGLGMLRYITDETNRIPLQTLLPEAITSCYNRADNNITWISQYNEWTDVVLLGSGIGRNETAEKLFFYFMNNWDGPMIIDGDGLFYLSACVSLLRERNVPTILTPHMAEMARLLHISVEELKNNTLEYVRSFAMEYHCICVCKDASTIIACDNGEVYISTAGCDGMATAGSGDVLAGIIAGICALCKDVYKAARLGVLLHGIAGERAALDKGNASMLASDILDHIPFILKNIE